MLIRSSFRVFFFLRLGSSGRAAHAAQPAVPAAQPAAVRALQEGAARRPQPPPPPTHHQRHRAGGAEQRHGKSGLLSITTKHLEHVS